MECSKQTGNISFKSEKKMFLNINIEERRWKVSALPANTSSPSPLSIRSPLPRGQCRAQTQSIGDRVLSASLHKLPSWLVGLQWGDSYSPTLCVLKQFTPDSQQKLLLLLVTTPQLLRLPTEETSHSSLSLAVISVFLWKQESPAWYLYSFLLLIKTSSSREVQVVRICTQTQFQVSGNPTAGSFLLAFGPWEHYLTSVNLSFFIHKAEMIVSCLGKLSRGLEAIYTKSHSTVSKV